MKKTTLSIIITALFSFYIFAGLTQAKTKTYDYKDFNAVSLSSGMHLVVTQSDNYSIEVTASEDTFKDLKVEKHENSIEFSIKHHFFSFGNHGNVEIKITMPELKELSTSGGSSAEISMKTSGSFEGSISGGGSLEGELTCEKLSLDVSGGGSAKLSGKSESADISGSGGCHFKLKDFATGNLNASLNGGSSLYITTNGDINAEGSGGSRIIYYGNAKTVNSSFSGGSSIKKGD
jgi:Putative auto-transporter adhesin, head GIN domain